MGKREIGLLLFGCSWLPSFRIGDTTANFQDRGNIPRVKEALIKDVITGRVVERLSLITRTGMLLIPGDLLSGIDLTIWATSSQSTCIKLNWSITGKILLGSTGAERSKLHSLARELILSTATCPTDEKNRLKSFATVLSSLLNYLILADFLGINDRIVFHNWLELLGLLVIWWTAKARSTDLISLLTSFLTFL